MRSIVRVTAASIAFAWLGHAALADACSTGTRDAVSADLASAQKEKNEADQRLQETQELLRNERGDYNVDQQVIDSATQAVQSAQEADDLLARRIAADQDCLKASACSGLVSVQRAAGSVTLTRGSKTLDAVAGCGLQPGDELSAGKDGSADLVVLSGKRTLRLGPGQLFKVPSDDAVSHLLDDTESTLIGSAGP